jgi:hypothetical protein
MYSLQGRFRIVDGRQRGAQNSRPRYSLMHRRHLAAVILSALCALSVLPLQSPRLHAPQVAQLSREARAHLEEIVTVLQTHWLRRNAMDWNQFKRRVFERAGAAQTIPDTYEAIRFALGLLGDKHTYDLRNSRGGNMWPALAALGPVIGEGTAGYFADAEDKLIPWGYKEGRAWLDWDTVAVLEPPRKAIEPQPRVAVLTDIGVVSSGEAIAIAFRGRPNTRSFGTPTCGLSTGVQQIPLETGGRVAVVNSVIVDRTKKRYGGVLQPDVAITEPSAIVPRALAWLRTR